MDGDIAEAAGDRVELVVVVERVAARRGAAEPRLVERQRGVAHAQRAQDPALDLSLERVPGEPLDQHPQQGVVRVGVRPRRAGGELLRRAVDQRQQLLRRPVLQRIALEDVDVRRQRVVRDAAGVVEQLADRDPVRVRQDRAEPAGDRVAQRQPALAHELQHDGRDHRLGVAARAEAVVRAHAAPGAHVGDAGGALPHAPAVVGVGDDAGRAGGDHGCPAAAAACGRRRARAAGARRRRPPARAARRRRRG